MKRNHKPSNWIGLVTVLVLASCEQKMEAPPENASQSWPAVAATDDGNYTVTIQPDPKPITGNQHFSIDLKVQRAADLEEDYELSADADMPAHRHGMNTTPETTKLGADHYRVDGMLFHMLGDWVITVKIGKEGNMGSIEFPVHID